MLTITSRTLREVAFDPAGNKFLGRVELTYAESELDPPQIARITARLTLPSRSRYPQIESAMLAEAERQLRLRLAMLDSGPVNIFVDQPAPPQTLAA